MKILCWKYYTGSIFLRPMFVRAWIIVLSGFFCSRAEAQIFISAKGSVTIFSESVVESFSAINQKPACLFNAESGQIALYLLIRDFESDKILMERPFQEDHMEGEKFPTAVFQGYIRGFDWKACTHEVKASGKLTIHGITREVEIAGTMERRCDKVRLYSKFVLSPKDFNIPSPKILWHELMKEVEVVVDLLLERNPGEKSFHNKMNAMIQYP